MIEQVSKILVYGDKFRLKGRIKNPTSLVRWTEEKFEYVKYNPRKNVPRWGLSVTSLDGELSGVPDLDSLHEYNAENGTTYTELDFNEKTIVYENPQITEILEPYSEHITRTHILKIGPGGFFPPHRDSFEDKISTVRLIVPLKNCDIENGVFFLLEDKPLRWEEGTLYFLNTTKVHTLFNASFNDSYWLVVNLINSKESFKILLEQLGTV